MNACKQAVMSKLIYNRTTPKSLAETQYYVHNFQNETRNSFTVENLYKNNGSMSVVRSTNIEVSIFIPSIPYHQNQLPQTRSVCCLHWSLPHQVAEVWQQVTWHYYRLSLSHSWCNTSCQLIYHVTDQVTDLFCCRELVAVEIGGWRINSLCVSFLSPTMR